MNSALPTPPAPGLDFAYTARVKLGPSIDHGPGPQGRRARVLIEAGEFAGPRLRGRVLAGGADWQLTRADGCTELLAIYDMQCDDGTLIHVRNRALWYPAAGLQQGEYVVGRPEFEVPAGPHDWLNRHVFVCTIGDADGDDEGGDEGGANAVQLQVFRVLMPGDDGSILHLPAVRP